MARPRPPWLDPLLRPGAALVKPMRALVTALVPAEPPLELTIVGRTLIHAALVGLLAGVFGSAFLWVLEQVQHVLLDKLAGFVPLRAAGEEQQVIDPASPFRWWLLLILPAVGGVLSGFVSRFAPETRGGGGDAAIHAFHQDKGNVRRRVLWVKPLASIATLGTGGSGGREGPTMQIGAALGSLVGRTLALTGRERRTLMVAGVAAGISAVFRTPLGAALLAIEVLYRDDFESEALIPSVLASVIAYSVSLSVFGTQPLFGTLPHFPFRPTQLPLYLGLAIVISAGATAFEHTMHFAQKTFQKLPGPEWLRPGFGGLALGIFVVLLLFTLDPWVGNGHRGLSVLGGGYGAGQLAITGAEWAPTNWRMVQLLLALGLAKIISSAVTIGSGGAAGDFAPSIAIGGLLGGAFGMAMRLALDDPYIQPGAFALVGMAAFYAGIANVPLAALVMVSEVAGSYDLLVPLMLTEAIALIALRKVNLYPSQPRVVKDSPVHASPLSTLTCGDLIDRARRIATLKLRDKIPEVATAVDESPGQDVFPVLDDAGAVAGLLPAEALNAFLSNGAAADITIVADIMVPPLTFTESTELRTAAIQLVTRDLRAAPVLDAAGAPIGLIDQHDIMRASTAASPGDSMA